MQIDDLFARTGGPESMARELGVTEAQAAAGAAALTPAVLGGFKKQAQLQPAGLGGLLGDLGGMLRGVLGRSRDVFGGRHLHMTSE